MRILVCFGTRPEAIKMAILCKEFDKRQMPYKLCVTAQHREMLDQVLDFFQLKPDYDLDLMQPDQSLNALGARILNHMDAVFAKENFDLVLVHGDTLTSTMVALAAFYRKCRVGHIEAGLRTYNKNAPFPEELNRQLTGRIAAYHFAPTKVAQENLVNEGVQSKDIVLTGNTVIDALQWTVKMITENQNFPTIQTLKERLNPSKKLVLVTGHRRENLGEGLDNICKAIIKIADKTEVEVVFSLHMNPNVKDAIIQMLEGIDNIHLIDAVDYPAFVWLMHRAAVIVSDSGGIQEEAPSLHVPVVVTRKVTERREGIKKGYAHLVGTDTALIVQKVNKLLNKKPKTFKNPYGDGKASSKIADFIEKIKH